MLRLFFIACLLAAAINRSVGQIVYVSGYTQNPFKAVFFKVDLATCTICVLAEDGTWGGYNQFIILPDGTVIRTLGGIPSIAVYPLGLAGTYYNFPSNPSGIVQMPDGTIYVAGTNGLGTFDPVSGTYNFIGPFPPAFTDLGIRGLFLYNGEVYGFTVSGGLFQVDINDPSQTVVLSGPPDPPFFSGGSIPGGPVLGVFQSQLLNYDMATNTTSPLCDFPGYILQWVSPPDPSGPPLDCPCGTDAGSMSNAAPASFCTGEQAGGTFNNDEELDGNDLLQFILFSNPADTLGSIVAVSATPSFSFNPATMQTGVTYYIAAIAGNNVGGNVDLDDPCLDISNAIQVIWRPLPSVVFSAADPDVCAGSCTTVTANFTGTVPFTLTYSTPAGTVTQTYSGNTATFQICMPAGAPPGSFDIQATVLTDFYCICN
jgi:hypothetical protein